MAVTRLLNKFRGHEFCVLIDPHADSVEVVYERGYERDESGEDVEFLPSYYDEQLTTGLWDSIMVRCLEDGDVPVGLMLEHFSRSRRRGLRRPEFGPLEAIDLLMVLAYRHLPALAEQTESMLAPESSDPDWEQMRATLRDLKLNGERVG